MIKVGDYLCDGRLFCKAVEYVKKTDLWDVEVIASSLTVATNQVGKWAAYPSKYLNKFKNLGNDEEIIKLLYPDYYTLKPDVGTVYILGGNQLGKSGVSLISLSKHTVIQNVTLSPGVWMLSPTHAWKVG